MSTNDYEEEDFGGRSFLDMDFDNSLPAGDADDEGALDTRSYLLTGGRTGGGEAGVGVETIVVTLIMGLGGGHSAEEMTAIQTLCKDNPMAVAEVSARLHLPLGVVQVLVGDMVANGMLLRSQKAKKPIRRDVAFIERLIDRVSAL